MQSTYGQLQYTRLEVNTLDNDVRESNAKIVHSDPFLSFKTADITFADGAESKRSWIELKSLYTVIVVAEIHVPGDVPKIVMVENYRHPIGQWSLETPGGLGDPDELPTQSAIRELEEETGIKLDSEIMIQSGVAHVDSGLMSHPTYFYHVVTKQALDLTHSDKADNISHIEAVDKELLMDKIRNGEISHAPSLLGLAFAGIF